MANENYVMMANNPTGTGSFSLNRKEGTIVGFNSHAEGYNNEASSNFSHAEGFQTIASGERSHAEGDGTNASNFFSHAEGQSTTASGTSSHAEGMGTTASGTSSHAEGMGTVASGVNSHAEGYNTTATGNYSHAEGCDTTASGLGSHAEGSNFYSSSSVLPNRTVTISDVNYTIGSPTAYGINSHAEGTQSFAYGYSSHAEGHSTTASGDLSHAEGYGTTASGEKSHAEGHSTTASGIYSHAEGGDTTASGLGSHAEGRGTSAKDRAAHAEGYYTEASGDYSHAEGYKTISSGQRSHAEGYNTISSASFAHAEGTTTTASGAGSHAEGCRSVAQGPSSHAEGWSDDISSIGSMTVTAVNENVLTFGDTTFTSWSEISKGKSIISLQKNKMKMIISDFDSNAKTLTLSSAISVAVGDVVEIYSHGPTMALGKYSHAEGYQTRATGEACHTEGYDTRASEYYSHAEGRRTTASANYAHAEGNITTASGHASHAEGDSTTASASHAHAEGKETTASNYASHASGKYNVAMKTGGTYANTTGTAFVIGNGTSSSALSNAFSVQYNGTVKAKSTITASTTADYAEFFEWIDKNINEEDRVGHFVTLDGDKIKIATSEDDYILGIISGEPFVLGNGDCDTWNGMFLHDEFRRTMYEPAPKIIEILDNEGNPTGEYEEVEGEYEGTRPILNPNYDPTQKYISRFDRAEWSPVGMLGVLAVLHDGTAEVNGYVTVNDEGIATKCTKDTRNSYRVIKKISDKVVEVIFR